MANRKLKRYGLEDIAKTLIVIGVLFLIFAWIAAAYYFTTTGSKMALLIVPSIFTFVLALLLLVIRYRYTLFEDYPYLMNLPSLFYRIKEKKGTDNQSIAFSMIFTVHALVIAFLGLLSLILTISIGSSVQRGAASPYLYLYLVIIGILGLSVLLQYRRIYLKFAK